MKSLFVFSSGTVGRRARLPTEPGPETIEYTSPGLTSPIKSPPYNSLAADSDDNSCKCKYIIKHVLKINTKTN